MKQVINYTDFEKMDFRIGKVIAVSEPEWSKKLLRFEVDFGELGKRIIFSGVKKWYEEKDFLNKQFVFLLNMEPKKMGDEESQGMMIMADTVDGNEGDVQKPTLMPLMFEVENGTVVR